MAAFCRGGCEMRKIGDKIKIKSLEELSKIAERRFPFLMLKEKNIQAGYYIPFNIERMANFCNKNVKIIDIRERNGYKIYIMENGGGWMFVEWMIKEPKLELE